ncbi:MAG: sugar transferase [Bacteroidaceae bacterium]|nr:sugar transferase [Bacteroidaceae bacterium]
MYKFAKRCFDILFAVLFLIVFSPVYLLTWIVIKIVSPGPAVYHARRVGLHGKVFTCYKFRSMRVDSGKVKLTTLQNDDRIFPFGSFIRKTKIDEMPQVVNILRGEMSVVGPRPEDEANASKIYVGDYRHILDVKPGLTSPASLYDYTHGEKYEDEEAYEREFVPQKLQLELYYVRHQSFGYDIMLVLKTAWLIILTACGKKEFELPKELAAEQ